MLIAQNLRVALGKRHILHGISFAARSGEVTSVIGPNGSGKTTLMRALSGELSFDGTATLDGMDITKARASDLATRRGVLPQHTNLAFPFTVHEVVRLGLTTGISAVNDTAGRLVERALERVDLQGFGPRFYQELSGGEQQRVQLARVLCQVWEPVQEGCPRYLFLDEPVASLDIKHQLQIMAIAADYANQGGGVLAIMHDLNLTAAFSHHVCLLSEGHLFAQGTPDQVLKADNLEHVYGCRMRVGPGPDGQTLLVLPRLDPVATAQ